MPAIAANTRLSISLPAGNTLIISGSGTVQVAPPLDAGVDGSLRTLGSAATTLGPYRIAETINIETGATGAVYTTSDGAAVPPLTNSEANATRALVSGAGIPFNTLPAASGDVRALRVSNVGPRGSLWLADGVDWAPQGGRVLLGRGVDIGGNRTITGSTTETSVYSLVIPGGVMGSFGRLVVDFRASNNNNANIKTMRIKLGPTQWAGGPSGSLFPRMTPTTNIVNDGQLVITNMGAPNVQRARGSILNIAGGLDSTTPDWTNTIDTTVDQTLEITLQLAVGTDTMTLQSVAVILERP